MLIFYCNWAKSGHSLDDFILILEASLATPTTLESHENGYRLLTDCLGMPCQEAKDCTGTVVPVFCFEIDATLFEARIDTDKLQIARDAIGNLLSLESLTLQEAQSLTGFLSFAYKLYELGWGFSASFGTLRSPIQSKAHVLPNEKSLPRYAQTYSG